MKISSHNAKVISRGAQKMSHCVPNWDLDDRAVPTRFDLRTRHSTSAYSGAPNIPTLDYEMAELAWENGQLAMHGLGLPCVPTTPKHVRESPRANPGTLESIVNLATQKRPPGDAYISNYNYDDVDLVPWFDARSHHGHPQHHLSFGGIGGGKSAPAAEALTIDALVPCATTHDGEHEGEGVPVPVRSKGVSTCELGSSTRVDSCSGPDTWETSGVGEDEDSVLKAASSSVARVPVAGEYSGEQSVSASVGISDTIGEEDSRRVPTLDTCEREVGGFGFTTTSFCSRGNSFSSSERPGTTNTTSVDDHDSVCHSRPQKIETAKEKDKKRWTSNSSISTKRSRATIYNQSERKRRDKINQKMKMLQKLVPRSSKTDKSSMLDEIIDYVKQLQAQVLVMSRMTIPSMMMIMQQQQLQMSMMAPMAMGMGMGAMGMGMDIMNMNINPMARQSLALAGLTPVMNPTAAFMPMAPTDPTSTYLACQSQPMTMEAYSRMVSLIQQQQAPSLKNGKFC